MKRPPYKRVPLSSIVWSIALFAVWAGVVWVSSLPRG